MRGASRASLFGSAEIQDAIAVCKWASKTLAPRGIILVGSSAAVDGMGCTGEACWVTRKNWIHRVISSGGKTPVSLEFACMLLIVVGRHQEATLKSEKPKFFIMGTEDGFTSVNQLQNKLKSAARQSRQPPDRRSWPFFRWSISYPHLLNPCSDSNRSSSKLWSTFRVLSEQNVI
ncbi:unnamed protein product [Musa textilis]